MRVISKRALREFWEKHSNAKSGLLLWYQRISKVDVNNFSELRQIFSSADVVGNFVIFNISGNSYRLVTYIDYKDNMVFIRAILTHAEYNKEKWKNDDWY